MHIRILYGLAFDDRLGRCSSTHYSNFPPEVILDFAGLDGTWGMLVDDRGQFYKPQPRPTELIALLTLNTHDVCRTCG
jgi:hypothetical protein